MAFQFSFVGLGIVVVLMLFSILVQWIYVANIKYKNKDIKTTITENSVKYSSTLFNNKVRYQAKKWNFWSKDFSVSNKTVYTPMSSFATSTVYSQVDTSFKSGLVAFSSNKRIDVMTSVVSKVAFLLAVNMCWLLVFNMWIIALALLGTILVMFAIEQIALSRVIKKSVEFTREKLHGDNEQENKAIDSYLKYKKMYVLHSLLIIFAEPIISGFAIFRDWGKNE